MEKFEYIPKGVCARKIEFELEDGKLHNVHFTGGCAGNTLAISKLLEGADAGHTVEILKGNLCGFKNTSCADQLALGIQQALAK